MKFIQAVLIGISVSAWFVGKGQTQTQTFLDSGLKEVTEGRDNYQEWKILKSGNDDIIYEFQNLKTGYRGLTMYNGSVANGLALHWDAEGNLRMIKSFLIGFAAGPEISFYQNGKKQFEKNFYLRYYPYLISLKELKKDSIVIIEEEETGNLFESNLSLTYELRHGYEIYYNEDGSADSILQFDRGSFVKRLAPGSPELSSCNEVKTGTDRLIYYGEELIIEESWYPDGSRKFFQSFLGDTLNGLKISWYPGNKLKSVESYLIGIKAGPFLKWHPNGELAEQGRYYKPVNDALYPGVNEIILTDVVESTILQIENPEWPGTFAEIERNTRKELKNGEWLYYDDRGDLASREMWEMGKLVLKQVFLPGEEK